MNSSACKEETVSAVEIAVPETEQRKQRQIEQKIERSLRYSIIDGTFYCIMVGMGEQFFSALAVFLKASNMQLGLLGTLPQVFGSMCQLFAARLLSYFRSRQRMMCLGAFLQGCMYFPIASTLFLGSWSVPCLIAFVVFYSVCGMMLGPVWNSWMGDLVPAQRRGSYFGIRNCINGLASFTSVLAGGYILYRFSHSGLPPYVGFVTLFTLAFMARSMSSLYLAKKYEPPYRTEDQPKIGFRDFVSSLATSQYGTFARFMWCMNFSVFVSSPYFAAYMLKDLQLDYFTFTSVTGVLIITKLLIMPIWGRMCDRVGSRRIIAVTGFLLPTVPVIWLLEHEIWYLLLIQTYGGIVWSGFEIATCNYVFESTQTSTRVAYISYYNVINGMVIFCGGIIGGLLLKYKHVFGCDLFWSQYFYLFLLSGMLRLLATSLFISKLRQLRP